MPEISGLGLPPPSSDNEANGAGAFGGQLQTARNDHWQTDCFGDDRTKTTETESFLAGFNDVFFLDRFDVDDAIRMKADLGKCGCEQVRSGEAPNHLSLRPSSDPSCERGCGSPVNSTRPSSSKLVDRSICQAAAGKPLVDLANTKWQNGFRTGHPAFEMLDAISKIGNNRARTCLGHSKPSSKSGFHLTRKRVCSVFVPNPHMSQCACSGE
ncbi:hypothetical protein FHT87_005911 [Rhizobium sp. BK316]|nr:hypothetical protein [Rhizobium sp. BK316]